MDLIVFFDTTHGSYCTILANFYLYLQYFQQKIFNFYKIKRNLIVRDTHTNTLATGSTANRSLN